MAGYHHLPSMILLGVAVIVFFTLQRHHPSSRVRVWLCAWVVVFVRILFELYGAAWGLPNSIVQAFDLGGLQLSGILFLLSTTRMFEVKRLRVPMLLTIGLPTVLYAVAFGLGYEQPWLYIAGAVWLTTAAIAWIHYYHRGHLEPYLYAIEGAVVVAGTLGASAALMGRADLAFYTVEVVTYALTGFLIWKYSGPRNSTGVLLTSISFAAWASVFPLLYLVNGSDVLTQAVNEIAGVPRYLVAFGMIVMMLEDETATVRGFQMRESELRASVQDFNAITSRLLSGLDVANVANEICAVITRSTTFHRATLLLTDDQRRLYLAGHSAVSDEVVQRLNEAARNTTIEQVAQLCRDEYRLGMASYRIPFDVVAPFGAQPSGRVYNHAQWRTGDEAMVPLRSAHGLFLGFISLDEPEQPERATREEMAPLETLAADMAIAIENATLQTQLIRSEKLAGLGQLVAGAAHELNNPLTAILGYTEMLSETAPEETRRELDIVRREAMRMKTIIESLLRFARQGKFERRPILLPAVIEDVMKLRGYDFRKRKVEVVVDVANDLPGVVIEEGTLKQVLLNLINNALDAVENSEERKVRLEATATENNRVQLRVSDSGSGFAELNRVFDPFYTTKPIGKGTGLGLSICYGIVKEHGGEINAVNLHPNGACIVVELPAAHPVATITPNTAPLVTAGVQ